MYGMTIYISIVLTLLLFVVGGIVGWFISLYVSKEEVTRPSNHPEFLDG